MTTTPTTREQIETILSYSSADGIDVSAVTDEIMTVISTHFIPRERVEEIKSLAHTASYFYGSVTNELAITLENLNSIVDRALLGDNKE